MPRSRRLCRLLPTERPFGVHDHPQRRAADCALTGQSPVPIFARSESEFSYKTKASASSSGRMGRQLADPAPVRRRHADGAHRWRDRAADRQPPNRSQRSTAAGTRCPDHPAVMNLERPCDEACPVRDRAGATGLLAFRTRPSASAKSAGAGATVWITTTQRIKVKLFENDGLSAHPFLVVVVHGDESDGSPAIPLPICRAGRRSASRCRCRGGSPARLQRRRRYIRWPARLYHGRQLDARGRSVRWGPCWLNSGRNITPATRSWWGTRAARRSRQSAWATGHCG